MSESRPVSYYTPASLISALLIALSTLFLTRRPARDNPETSLAAITVCDPACGSGHFLIGAQNRIRSGRRRQSENAILTSAQAIRRALRAMRRGLWGSSVKPDVG